MRRRCIFASTLTIVLALLLAPSAFARKKKKPLPKLTVAVLPTNVNEGNAATFTITASIASTKTLTVNYAMSGTATAGDFTISGVAGQATLLPGQTSTTVTLSARGDGVSPEPNESATMTLLSGTGYKFGNTTPQATVTIVDVAPPSAPVATAATNVSATGFTANWNAVGGANGYRLDVATDNAFTNFLSGFHDVDLANVLATDVANLAADTTYFFRVRAYNGGGTGGNSNVISVTTAPASGYFLPLHGLYTQIERRGWASEYWSGQLLQEFNDFDSVVGHTRAEEAALQLDKMREMGVNVITFELRSADTNFDPTGCNMPAVLGLQWPQPTATELTNLVAFLDLADSKGIKVWLRLVNNHMEEQPPTNSQTWLGAILNAIEDHPAIDLVLFEGDRHVDLSGNCGIPAEPPLWLGANSYAGNYVQWAISYAMGLGWPARKLSAECIAGDFFTISQAPAGSDATDNHLWNPVAVEKQIFDALNIPNTDRTYALSMYQHHKCSTVPGASVTATLTSVGDTHLRETNPDNNAGANNAFAAGANLAGKLSHGLVKFDLSSIPANAAIQSVTLTLTCVQIPSSPASSTFDLRRMFVNWSEGAGFSGNDAGRAALTGESTWNNRFHPSTPWSIPGAAAPTDFSTTVSASKFVQDIGSYVFGSTAALVADVQQWVADPATNFGWVLMSESEGTAGTHRLFGSRENSTATARPTLVIKYITSEPGTCTDEDPHTWADETLRQHVFGVIGSNNGARVVVPEMGILDPTESDWNVQHAVESLEFLFNKYGVDGATFWRWVVFDNSEESNPSVADAVKRRGAGFVYNSVQKEIVDLGGFHAPISNRSFENGGATPLHWNVNGNGTAARYFLAGESGQPEVPSRGQYDLRLTTGGNTSDLISATSDTMSILANTAYTTTANMRFNWSGDPNPSGNATTRPQIFVSFHYFDANGSPSSVRPVDTFRYFQEDGTSGFATFPMQYTTPNDAASLQIEIGAARNGLPTAITLDADNLR